MASCRAKKTVRGFTLIELMVVIVLIAILALLGSSIDFNKINNEERSKQFARNVSNLISTEVIHALSGKSILQSGVLAYPWVTRITLTNSWVVVGYYSGSILIQTGPTLSSPFYGDNWYSISAIRMKNGSSTYALANGDVATIDLAGSKDTVMSYSGASSWDAITLEMDLGYHGINKTLEYDRRSNIIQMK